MRMPKTIEIADYSGNLKDLVDSVLAGEDVVIARDDVPLVRLTVVDNPLKKRIPGLSQGMAIIRDDFDDPLPDEFWFGEE